MPTPLAKLFLWHGRSLYIGPMLDNGLHRHYAIQLTLSSGRAFTMETDEGHQETSFHITGLEQPHAVKCITHPVAILLVEPDSRLGECLLRFQLQMSQGEIDKISALPFPDTNTEANAFVDKISQILQVENFSEPEQHAKIARVVDYLSTHQGGEVSARAMADIACLSESRFLHVFKDELGLPFRRYIKWKRLMDAVKAVVGGTSLTEAAHMAGFSDQAHLSRAFREMFGLSPSKIFQDSQFVQVMICDEG